MKLLAFCDFFHGLKENDDEQFLTFCDFSKTSGDGDQALGFL